MDPVRSTSETEVVVIQVIPSLYVDHPTLIPPKWQSCASMSCPPAARHSEVIDPLLVLRKKKKCLWFVYLHCIPTVVQAAKRETERSEQGREGGEERAEAAARKKWCGGCSWSLQTDGERGGGRGGEVGGRLAQSAVSDVGFTVSNPSGDLLRFSSVLNALEWVPPLPPPAATVCSRCALSPSAIKKERCAGTDR